MKGQNKEGYDYANGEEAKQMNAMPRIAVCAWAGGNVVI